MREMHVWLDWESLCVHTHKCTGSLLRVTYSAYLSKPHVLEEAHNIVILLKVVHTPRGVCAC